MTTATLSEPATDLRRGLQGVGLILVGVSSLQFGAALAATLFPQVGPLGVVTLRLLAAGAALLAAGRPRIRGRSGAAWRTVLIFGVVTAAMNASLYVAIDRLPLGAVITFEFLGPLTLALALSRRWLDVMWAACAGGGVLLLAEGLRDLDLVGVVFALVAAACWAGYIVLNRRLGGAGRGGVADLALAVAFAGVLVAPLGIVQGGAGLLDPHVLLLGVLVGVLSSAVPYSFDLLALRRLPARVFGVLCSVHPAVAALAGLVVLHQHLSGSQWLAIGLVIVASAGVTLTARPA
ncbi:EamA family transporter [Luedemannella helvata]|uniref:EamA family transporter n=1 Tax=Luedemannella helvata TaxID=349315 RepID=A0ABP4WCP5_9ACTN